MVRSGTHLREKALRDYAQAHASQREVEALRTKLVQAQQEASGAEKARLTFLSGLNHELRTPLNHIIGFAELLKQADEYGFDDHKREEYLDLILGAAGTLLDQINAILVSAGYGEPTPAPDTSPSLVTVLRRIMQENAAKLFVGKVDIADELPLCGLSSRDLYKALQMVFGILTDTARERRTLGVKVEPPSATQGEIVLTLSVLSSQEGLDADILNPARAELIRQGARLDVTVSTGAFQVIVRLPAQEQRQVA